MIRNLDGSGDVLLASRGLRKNRGHQVIGFHALNRGRILFSAPKAQDRQRTIQIPAPARRKDWQRQYGLGQRLLDPVRRQKEGHIDQGKAVVRSKREHHRVIVRRRLQFEVKTLTKLLSEGETKSAIQTTAPRCMNHELHAARIIKKAL